VFFLNIFYHNSNFTDEKTVINVIVVDVCRIVLVYFEGSSKFFQGQKSAKFHIDVLDGDLIHPNSAICRESKINLSSNY